MTADINIIFLRGFLFYYTGELSKAMNVFKKSFEELNHQASKENLQHKLSTVSLLTIAQINFVQKNYSEALSYYKKALIQNKNLPVNARFGMAYCFYELEKYQMAEMCFKRILALSPKSVDALIGMAVIRYKD
jgi:tetratricopeptide (TPR) repeat protein